jgi:MoaA/NifB/PqqE/SkfB family radical SAM enzyme
MNNPTRVVESRQGEQSRIQYMQKHMAENKAYLHAVRQQGGDPDGALLRKFRQRFERYRADWRGQPRRAIEERLHGDAMRVAEMLPLCVDIEVAALCDLACPFCYRQWIATPDKLMTADLCRRILDQCGAIGVPSVKLNWRGEPLLHPRLPEFVDHAKRVGVIETIINTNAVTLDEKKSRALIEAGIDLVIYSFDGGSKETYERMRVGRFAPNRFEDVYENIRRFARLRREYGAAFPRTKIQMILTEDTAGEQEEFSDLFRDCVDDVSVKAYSERGGHIADVSPDLRAKLRKKVPRGIPVSTACWRDMRGAMYVATGRMPCAQPFQRLMVTYDGCVCMCCYDWGCQHPIGYVDAAGYETGSRDYDLVIEHARAGRPGFEPLAHVRKATRYVDPPRRVQDLRNIWHGAAINHVREMHVEGHLEDVAVCRRCVFKETYKWVKTQNRRDVSG